MSNMSTTETYVRRQRIRVTKGAYAGSVWIVAGTLRTLVTDELRIVAWHPDSDTGPSDDDHPMLNRSMVNGVSAAEIDEIRTR